MHRRRFLAATAAATAVAGCVALPSLSQEYDVGMSANAFAPDVFEVAVGEEVVWLNDGSRGHTVTAYETGIPEEATFFASGGFDSEAAARDAWAHEEGGNIVTGERYTHTFDVAGRYLYFCIPHESRGMVGEIVVEA